MDGLWGLPDVAPLRALASAQVRLEASRSYPGRMLKERRALHSVQLGCVDSRKPFVQGVFDGKLKPLASA